MAAATMMAGAAVWWTIATAFLLVTTTHAQRLQPITLEELVGTSTFLLVRSGTQPTQCRTPQGQQGLCGPATTCSFYLPLLNDSNLRNTTIITFFRKRVCRHEPGLIHVCCPLEGSPTTTTAPPASQPHNSPIFFLGDNQPPKPPVRTSNGPSQRPNARRPILQGGSRGNGDDPEEDEAEVAKDTSSPTHNTGFQLQPRPVPPPRQPQPTTKPTTTTTRAPTHVLSQSNPQPTPTQVDRRLPPVRGPVLPSDPVVETSDQTPSEPSEPPILPAEGECGTIPHGKIGTTPWVVSVGVLDKLQFQVRCSGALISRQHVIAAAHCLHAPVPTHVRLGAMDQSDTLKDVPLLTWTTPSYSASSRDNDLALLTLAEPVTFTDNIQPVCLPFRYRLDGFQGQQLQVVGWGRDTKPEADAVQVEGLSRCREAYHSPSLVARNEVLPFSSSSFPSTTSSSTSSSIRVLVDRRHLCGSPASFASTASTVCLSDFGAPLIFHDQHTTGLHFLAGVSSVGDGCPSTPGLYTRVGAFIPWLVKELSAHQVQTPDPSNRPRSIHFGD